MFDDLRRALTRNTCDDERGTHSIAYVNRANEVIRVNWLTERQAQGRARALTKRGYRVVIRGGA